MSEKDFSKENLPEKHGVHVGENDRVKWCDSSKEHPRNWGRWSKSYTSIVVIWLEAYMTAISSAGVSDICETAAAFLTTDTPGQTASAKDAAKEYGSTMVIGYLGFVTVYLVGQAIGGIVLAPVSELFGRRTIYIIGTLLFGIASMITGVPPHIAAAIIGRFLQGFAAAIPATVAFGNFTDMYDASTRVWVVYWYTICGMAGLALGPIYSAYVTALLGWRWVYHISAMMSAASLLACCFIRESNASQILQKKTSMIRKETGNQSLKADIDDGYDEDATFQGFMTSHIYRPLMFLFTEPIVMLCAILCSIAFSLLYASTESLSIIYTTSPFDSTFTSSPKASLAFLAILIGEILNVLPRVYDHAYLNSLRRRKQRILPESKIYSFAVACPALAIGLWLLAWTVPQRITNVPWPVSMIGLICIGFAANDFSYTLFGYVTDSYGFYAASAVSAVSTARTLAAGIFPLFVTYMYEGLGNNHATTILAVIATLFCFTPWLFIRKGQTLRERSKWADKGDACLQEENSHLDDGNDRDIRKDKQDRSSQSNHTEP